MIAAFARTDLGSGHSSGSECASGTPSDTERHAQGRMEQQLADLGGELYADPLQYWPRAKTRRRNRR